MELHGKTAAERARAARQGAAFPDRDSKPDPLGVCTASESFASRARARHHVERGFANFG
jgi:hypothetical protein